MDQASIIGETEQFVKKTLQNAEGGHDWYHTHRVRTMALQIAQAEQADLFVVELAALLHDIADSKFHDGNEDIGPQMALDFLQHLNVDSGIREHVVKIIENISFKGGNHAAEFSSSELEIVQDADRLDALGAIGIARTFNYGGFKNQKLFDPDIPPQLNMTKEEYKSGGGPTINHFYEKLLLLKDRMNTSKGKELALVRHEFMEQFLDRFYSEWKSNA